MGEPKKLKEKTDLKVGMSDKIDTADFKTDEDKNNHHARLGKRTVAFSRIKRRILKHVYLLRIFIIVGISLAIVLTLYFSIQAVKNTQTGYYFGLLGDFIFTPEEKINSVGGSTNLLILGKGGTGHEAPDLTDTIMLVSVDFKEHSINLISLPRDIWLPDLRTKLNSVYYWGNKKEAGGGLILAKSTVEEILGAPVSYAAVLDFSGFKKTIDVLGEIEVDVANPFVDEKYPIAGRESDLCGGDLEFKCRYETLHFAQGKQLMNGEVALKFVRSRNAEGDEGTDLARATRQERVIEAIKNKVLSREIITSPKKLLELKKVALESLETDINPSEGAILARKIFDARDKMKSNILSEDFLENPPKSAKYDNLYVFIPKEIDPEDPTLRSWSKVHEWVKCVLEENHCETEN